MAVKILEVHKVRHTNVLSEAKTPVTFTASDKVKVLASNKNTIIRLVADTAGSVVVKAGNSPFSSGQDLTLSLSQGKEHYIELDTAQYKNTTGENKGFIILEPKIAGSGAVITK